MNEIIEKEKNLIEDKIYKINGVEVMLDSDLAELYHVETKRINEAVYRNKDKFPNRISWVATDTDVSCLWSQNATANISSKSRTNPRVFTEQGVYMLATILKSKEAIEVSIRIMDTFVKMRHYINYDKLFLPNRILLLEDKVDNNTKRIDELFDKFDPSDITDNKIFFDGDFYDAYRTVLNIFKKAKNTIVIIDSYADKELLDIIRTLNTQVTIITKTKGLLTKLDVEKYNKQYSNLKVIYNDTFHDRYFLLDDKVLYHCGASLNKIGSKTFSINLIKTEIIIKEFMRKIGEII